jgi:membrane associated rhomboid family serine protease
MPPVTRALLIANLAVFALQYLGGGGALLPWFALWPPTSSPTLPTFELWQLVTYSFLHGSVTHIFFNMLALYMFGSDVERLFGSRFYLAYYFACVVAAGICHLTVTGWMGGPLHPTVGASGGVYGLLLAFAVYFPHRKVLLIFPPIPMPARVFVAVFAGLELVFGVTGTQAGVAHFAHLGGLAGGWLMIQYRRRRFPFAR